MIAPVALLQRPADELQGLSGSIRAPCTQRFYVQDVIGQTPKPVASKAAAQLLPACAKAANDAAPAIREAAVDCLVGFALKTGVSTPAKVWPCRPGQMMGM